MVRKLLLGLLALTILVIAGHTLLWRWTERRLEEGYTSWVAARRMQGWSIDAATPVPGGWPLEARLTVPKMVVKGGAPDIPDGLTWSTDRVDLSISLLHPRQLTISSDGLQRLRFSDFPDIPYTADRLHADIPLDPGVPPHTADISAVNLRAGMPAGPDSSSGLGVGELRIHGEIKPAAPAGEAALEFTLKATTITLPPGRTWPLGPTIAGLTVDGALNGPVPKSRGLTTRATGWRDGGGTLEIQGMHMDWGPMGLSATATIALDDQLQPMGTGTAKLSGYAESLDALAANNAVTKRAALAANAVLSLLAHAPDDGGPPEVEVPLTLQDRTLSVRQIPLSRLPMLDWPAP